MLLPLALLAVEKAPTPGKQLPNVVIIFVDDMGYADIGPFGARPGEPLWLEDQFVLSEGA